MVNVICVSYAIVQIQHVADRSKYVIYDYMLRTKSFFP